VFQLLFEHHAGILTVFLHVL